MNFRDDTHPAKHRPRRPLAALLLVAVGLALVPASAAAQGADQYEPSKPPSAGGGGATGGGDGGGSRSSGGGSGSSEGGSGADSSGGGSGGGDGGPAAGGDREGQGKRDGGGSQRSAAARFAGETALGAVAVSGGTSPWPAIVVAALVVAGLGLLAWRLLARRRAAPGDGAA